MESIMDDDEKTFHDGAKGSYSYLLSSDASSLRRVTPEDRNLISVRCYCIIDLLREGG